MRVLGGEGTVLWRKTVSLTVSAAAVLAGVLSRPAAARADAVMWVRGTVTDESGMPVPACTVRLLKARTIVDLRAWRARDQDVEETRARSDAHGFFALQFPVDPKFRTYYLRFYNATTFDAVKYRLPEDQEISRQVRQLHPLRADVVLQFHPDWPKVKKMIEVYGPASPCGQVLRALGLPVRRIAQGGGRELWDYTAAGVSYLVEGSKILETRRAEKSADLKSSEPPAAHERAAPAERVQDQP